MIVDKSKTKSGYLQKQYVNTFFMSKSKMEGQLTSDSYECADAQPGYGLESTSKVQRSLETQTTYLSGLRLKKGRQHSFYYGKCCLHTVPHLPYDPDITPSDYHLFCAQKRRLREKEFKYYSQLKSYSLTDFLDR